MRTLILSLLLAVPTFAADRAPVKVEVRRLPDGGFRLLRGGQPYFVQGGGGNGSLKSLAAAGGNSFRTWGVDGRLESTLDEAQSLGLTVTLGIWLGQGRQGFDYTSADAVHKQLDEVQRVVLKYKDHPALLMWGVGNEVEGVGFEDNAGVYMGVNAAAALVHRLDPNHPTMTAVAEIGGRKVAHLNAMCPEVDVIGINSYAGIESLPKRYRDAGGTRPYVVTELGPPGTWESPRNAFGMNPELTSTQKAERYRLGFHRAVVAERDHLSLGGYAFMWGHKQEATATWFGTFLPDGTRLGAVDALAEVWTGKPPPNRCPVITELKLQGADDVEPGSAVRVTLAASDPENDPISVKWVLQAEQQFFGMGGDYEEAPATFPDAVRQSDATSATVAMPSGGGGYRLFAFVTDNHGGGAVANVALHVKGPVLLPKSKAATLPLVVYGEASEEQPSPAYIASGWIGNAKAIRVDPACETKPHGGKTCIRADFVDPKGWGGVVWQSPPGDWGDRPGGFDLTGAKRLTFWARGDKGGEVVTFQFGIYPKEKRFGDTATGKLERVKLDAEWREYSFDLAGKDLTRIKTGFAWTAADAAVTFYLDDIRYE